MLGLALRFPSAWTDTRAFTRFFLVVLHSAAGHILRLRRWLPERFSLP